MKIKIFILLFILTTIYSCSNENKPDNSLDVLIITVRTSKAESNPLNIILNLGVGNVIIYNTTDPVFEIPPPPKSMSNTVENYDSSYRYETEMLKINSKEVDSIFKILKEFDKDDYNNSVKTALDGTAITISLFYSNNTMKKIVLINDSNNNHRKLLKHIFQVVGSKTKQKKMIERYYKFDENP